MKSFSVARVNISPYQHNNFMAMEKALLEELPGIEYQSLSDLLPDKNLILITNTHTLLNKLHAGIVKRTKLIIHPNSGYDHFAADHALWEQIPLVIGHEIRAAAVAEYSLACVFQGLLELPQHLSWNAKRDWNRPLLKGTKVMVFGYGHIGKSVTDTLHQVGMDVTVIDPFIKQCSQRHLKSWQETNLKDHKIVIACCGLNKTSRKIFNHDFFSKASDELLFINGARGGLVEEEALKNFLIDKPKAFAFLDVFEKEPFGDEWRSFPQVWKTSHMAGVHQHLDNGILDFEKRVLSDFLKMNEQNFLEKYRRELLQNKWIQGELI